MIPLQIKPYNFFMKSNEELQKDIQDAIKWEPSLFTAEIGISAKDGIVTVTGVVDSYKKKLHVEDTVKNVSGVKAIIEKLEVNYKTSYQQTDTEVAKEVTNALSGNWDVGEKVQAKVEHGYVTLTGELAWKYQKDAAMDTVMNLSGVKGITNAITITPTTHDEIEKRGIESALTRNWAIDQDDISVEVTGNSVTLTGMVDSLYQKEEAERIAWNAPGVWMVDNEIRVGQRE
jgi:osmotically-inducible protein OsmY